MLIPMMKDLLAGAKNLIMPIPMMTCLQVKVLKKEEVNRFWMSFLLIQAPLKNQVILKKNYQKKEVKMLIKKKKKKTVMAKGNNKI